MIKYLPEGAFVVHTCVLCNYLYIVIFFFTDYRLQITDVSIIIVKTECVLTKNTGQHAILTTGCSFVHAETIHERGVINHAIRVGQRFTQMYYRLV